MGSWLRPTLEGSTWRCPTTAGMKTSSHSGTATGSSTEGLNRVLPLPMPATLCAGRGIVGRNGF